MGGVEGVRFVPLTISGNTPPDALTRLLLTGAVLRGRIAADGALLNLVVPSGQKLPLPKGVTLSPGTSVEARITHESGTPQLRLQVLETPAQAVNVRPAVPAQTAAPPVPVPPSLASLVKPEQAAALLPKAAAIPPKAIEVLLTVLATRPELGRALARLLPVLDVPAAERRVPAEITAAPRAASDAMEATSPEEFRRAIEIAREAIGARGERPVFQATQENQAPRSLIDDLLAIREQVTARAGSADGREIIRTIDTIVDRFSASTLQNVRAFDVPYQFFAIPFSPRTGIEHAQVHVLGRERGGAGGGAGREAHLVAIDLHLTNLGSMWITIQSIGAMCNCAIRTDNDAARGMIDAGALELEAGLRRAGFAAAQVRTEAWDGDRVAAAAALFAQTASFEAEA